MLETSSPHHNRPLLSSKANTLKSLYQNLESGIVLDQVSFTVEEFASSPLEIIEKVKVKFSAAKVIVRSSCQQEDNLESSAAGMFLSLPHIDPNSDKELETAIKNVIKSYGAKTQSSDQILIQPMVENITSSGVILTRTLESYSPYYIINFDQGSSHDSVTSGQGKNLRTKYIYRDYEHSKIEDPFTHKLLVLSKELEKLFQTSYLDIEFASDKNDNLYLLQVRPLVTKESNQDKSLDQLISKSLFKLSKKIEKISRQHPFLFGDQTVFGVMPDWNPAEIIGLRPKKLALSLYKELVTDSVWAYQRDNYGYKNLRSFPLLYSFLGIPFIDTRVSFNSFVPKEISDDLTAKIVNYYTHKLVESPTLHDKVEFEIVFSCYFFGIDQKLKHLNKRGFSTDEIKEIQTGLLSLTNKIVDPKNGYFLSDKSKIEQLKFRVPKVVASNMSTIDKIYWLIENCKRYGTLPFAGMARSAFVAMQFLKSFVSTNIITSEEYSRYLRTINTVAKQLSKDFKLYSAGKLTASDFKAKYGHLRPGTYDITCPNYAENFEAYFGNVDQATVDSTDEEPFNFSSIQLNKIDAEIKKIGLNTTSKDLLSFIKEAIEGREYLKFEFTKVLNLILTYTKEYAESLDFSVDDIAHLDIQQVRRLYSVLESTDIQNAFQKNIDYHKEQYEITKLLQLPQVITSHKEVYQFELLENEPTFITQKYVQAPISEVDANTIKGKIVLIPSADPGFDWIFSKKIGGLITMFGGANSHMSIRCAELGIPAVIGVGEKKYQQYSSASILEINAATKTVNCIS